MRYLPSFVLSVLATVLLSVPALAVPDSALAMPDAPSDKPASPAAQVTIEPVGNQMQFATESFTVAPGQQVTVVFENTASSPAMKHNVVVLTTGADPMRVGQAALSAENYIPDTDQILAHTALADPGETVEVTFTAPESPGEYPYVCTFPGHYTSMQGVMTVAE